MTYYIDVARAQAEALFNGNPNADQILVKIAAKLQTKSRRNPVTDNVVVVQNNPNTKVTFDATPVRVNDWEVTRVVRG
jgi:hypothetical protein